jgi:hypothetical protein
MSSNSKGRRLETKSGVRYAPYSKWHGFAKKSVFRRWKSQKWHGISDEIATVLFGRLPKRKVA